ncbi:MAG: Rpn family recombination-promoting nuclease/putative transposase [Myxococcota bacterium]
MSEKVAEPVGINPRIDCVFKTILGASERVGVLTDFLEAVLPHRAPITDVEILNPVSLPDLLKGMTPILDVRARDGHGRQFQVEMQTWNETGLRGRMVHNWADVFSKQIGRGGRYQDVESVISIWILDKNLLRHAKNFHHCFRLIDERSGRALTDLLEIHTIELSRWRAGLRNGATPQIAAWMRFFSEAEHWSALPAPLETPVFEEAMNVLQTFKENMSYNAAYLSRLDAIRRQRTIVSAYEEAKEELEQAEARLKAKQAELDAVKAEIAASKAEVAASKAEADASKAEADASKAEADASKAEADASKSAFDDVKAALAAERAERQRLEEALAALRAGRDIE